MSTIEIRLAQSSDTQAMLDIYRPMVTNSTVSFEYEAPDAKEFWHRIANNLTLRPCLVCQIDKQLMGYSYAGPYRSRSGYQWCTELSIYVHPEFIHRGIGSALYAVLIEILKLQGYRNAYAVITLPNTSSVAFHESIGFTHLLTYPKVGYKLHKWHDVGWWELPLADFDPDPIPPVPLDEIMHTPKFETSILMGMDRIKN